MQTPHAYFQNLAQFEVAVSKRPSLRALLEKSMDDVAARESCSELQMQYLIVAFAHVYHHFGFSTFSQLGRSLVVPSLSSHSGVTQSLVESWLENLCYQILEDFNVLKIVTGEPHWEQLSESFARDLAKRLLCTDHRERTHVGLEAFSPEWVREMYEVAARALAPRRISDDGTTSPSYLSRLVRIKNGSAFAPALASLCHRLAANPMLILAWRLESFAAFNEAGDEARFFVRREGVDVEDIANRYAALIALLLPHQAADGTMLMKETPVTLTQMCKALSEAGQGAKFDLSMIRTWLATNERDASHVLGTLVKGGLRSGLLFEVAVSKKQSAYGLTRLAQTIVGPFHAAITSALAHAENESAAPSDGALASETKELPHAVA